MTIVDRNSPASVAPGILKTFENSAREFSDRPAVSDGNQTLTYSELNRLANILAYALLERLGERSELVVFLLGPKPNSLQGFWGALKSGKGFVAIDPYMSVEKLRALTLDSTTRLLVTDNSYLSIARQIVADIPVEILNIDDLTSDKTNNPDLEISPDALGAVVYTSGATGQPKGLLRTVRELNARFMATSDYISTDRLIVQGLLTLGTNQNIAGRTAKTGGCIYFFDMYSQVETNLAEWVDKNGITVMSITPSVLRAAFGWIPEGRVFPSVRLFLVGGEAVTRQDFEIFKRYFVPGTKGLVVFASTDAGIISRFSFDHSTEFEGLLMPVGAVIPGKSVSIVDDQGNPVSDGEIGEIVVRAAAHTTVYWNNPNAQREKLKLDPSDPSQAFFYTGDLGRIRPDGLLEHRGRKDAMVKINGRRIEVGEIKAILSDHPQIDHVAITARPMLNMSDRLYLAIYYIPKENAQLTRQDLYAYFHKRLPDMRLPMRFIKVDSIPFNANGKTDFQALAASHPEENFHHEERVAPSNDMERRLLVIWQNAFQIKDIGVEDDFFELGGDSLLAMSLLLNIESGFKKKMPLTIILNASTIRQQAEILSNGTEVKIPAVIPVKISGKKPPVFWVPSGFGVDLYVQGMGRHLDPEQPLYLLAVPEVPKEQILMVEEYAKIYAEAIREFYPQGPYYLVGHSAGGIAACATANELMKSGAQIGWVGMLDSVPPDTTTPSIFSSLRIFVRNMTKLGVIRSLKDLGRNLFVYVSMSILNIKWIQAGILKSRKISIVRMLGPRESAYVKVYFTHNLYRPAPFRFDLINFKSTGISRYGLGDNKLASWERYAEGGLKFINVPGDHVSIMEEPHVQILARKICEQINN